MKTSELIAADRTLVRASRPAWPITAAALTGAALALCILAAWLGFQPLGAAVSARWFWMKAGYGAALGLCGMMLLGQLARPGARLGHAAIAIGGLAVTAMAMMAASALMRAHPGGMRSLWLGQTWAVCPWRILALAVPAYLALVWALRRLAPTRLALTGAAAGLLAGGVSAVVYGFYCQETAAPFVATWYSLGIGASALLGAVVGNRMLRW